MTTGKVVANAGSHRILEALAASAKDTKELKRIVGAINSVSRFDGEYMARMVRNGYVCKHGDKWHITEAGRERLVALGPLIDKSSNVATSRTPAAFTAFSGVLGGTRPIRPGALDYMGLPSIQGNKRIYKDGRIEIIGDDDGH